MTYKYLFGPIFMVGGLFFCFAGRKMFKPTVFLIGAVIASFLLLTIFYQTFLAQGSNY